MLEEANRRHIPALAIAREFEGKFHTDLARLNISPANLYPRASETIDLMLASITQLLASGNAYQGSDESIYFAANSFPDYGAISGNRLEALKPGHRYEYVDDGAKRFHADWALWKRAHNRTEMVWQTPWGEGFPGWHIECSAMSMEYLQGHVDLHLGGIDLRFPHHENERAQSNSLLAGKEAVDHWVHGEHLLFEGRKMSKSAGNVVLVQDLLDRGIDPLALRLCFLENRYRSQMDLTLDAITAANSMIQRWRGRISEWENGDPANEVLVDDEIESMVKDFENDLDTPKVIQRLRGLEKDLELTSGTKREVFVRIDELLGLDLQRPEALTEITAEVSQLLAARADARAKKDFALSDELRDKLAELKIEVRDTADGQKWERIY
jgi:cysteinyl-tRNA synthetase